MIKLFESDATEYTTGGIGILTNVYECIVHSSVSGIYELNMNMGVDDELFEFVKISNIIAVKPNMTDQYQGFVIEEITKNINGTIEIYATQVGQYRSKLIPVQPFTATDIQDALSKVLSNSLETNPFTLTTPRTTQIPYKLNEPKVMRDILGGVEGSLLDVYGGEYIFNNFDIQLVNQRGADRGFDVIYGNNMNEYKETSDFSWTNSVTGILPYYKGGDSGNALIGDIQYSQYADLYPYKKTICYDFTDKFDSIPTIQDLNNEAIRYLSNKGLPSLNIELSFADVSMMPEYNGLYNEIESIQLGDTISVNNWYFDRVLQTRVQELKYNVLLDRYESIVLGDVKGSVNDAIRDTVMLSTGGTGLQGFDLIWENTSTSNFSAQTISIDLSSYQFVLMLYSYTAAGMGAANTTMICFADGNTYRMMSGNARKDFRDMTINADSIVFGAGRKVQTYNQTNQTVNDNSLVIPRKIYGFR